MDENGSPQRTGGPDGYNRLSTLETESQSQTTTSAGAESIIHCYLDFHQQMESACHIVDWDRVFLTAFVAISLILITTAFCFPVLRSGVVTDQGYEHEFILNSLTISQFQVSQAQVTGKCDVVMNISNYGDRSLYHENSVLSIFMNHELLWVTRTGDFFVEAGNTNVFDESMNATSTVSVPASFVPTALLESRKLGRPVHFKLKYDGMIREGLDSWHEDRYHVYVVCGWIKMQFVNETTLQGGPASCSFENF